MTQDLSYETGAPFSDRDMHTTFSGGPRLYVICRNADVDTVIAEAKQDGHFATKVGTTVASGGGNTIFVNSQFKEKKALSF